MFDLVFAIAGGAFLLGAVALAILVDLAEARRAPRARPRAPTLPPDLPRPGRRLRLVRFGG